MILGNFIRALTPRNETTLLPEFMDSMGGKVLGGGQIVNAETTKKIGVAYRCVNLISDDVATLPFQQFQRRGRDILQVAPDAVRRNAAYLLDVSPNLYDWTPFRFKKIAMQWLLHWGNCYIWQPPTWPRQWLILPADQTKPVKDQFGRLWYETYALDLQKPTYLPISEVLHLLINPDKSGQMGRSILTFARETLSRRLGTSSTKEKIYTQGLNPAGIAWFNGELSKDARDKVRESYEEAIGSGGIVVFDNKISKFDVVTMKPVDAQFLQEVEATDLEIANFYGVPPYKVGLGKQSYESNSQQELEYLKSTLNPYLVQWEQAGRLRWLVDEDPGITYFRFIREALLSTDAKTRSEYLRTKIQSGQMTPNEARAIEDMSGYPEGDEYWMPSNMMTVRKAIRQNGQ